MCGTSGIGKADPRAHRLAGVVAHLVAHPDLGRGQREILALHRDRVGLDQHEAANAQLRHRIVGDGRDGQQQQHDDSEE
jgi:hypothetical protein